MVDFYLVQDLEYYSEISSIDFLIKILLLGVSIAPWQCIMIIPSFKLKVCLMHIYTSKMHRVRECGGCNSLEENHH